MADDLHYVPGDWYILSDRSGFKTRARRARMEWDNLFVAEREWEPRQPQDFVKGVRDDQTVPTARPRQLDQFQGPMGTVLVKAFTPALPGPPGPWFLYVESSVRYVIGDTLWVMMDNGVQGVCKIIDVPSQLSVQIDRNLPWTAAIGNEIINVSAESDPIISYPGVPED